MSEINRSPEAQQKTVRPAAQTPAGGGGAQRSVQKTGEIDLTEYAFRLISHWKLIVCTVVLFAVAGAFYGKTKVTPMYRATSTIYVVGTGTNLTFSNIQLGSYMMSDYIKVFDIWEVHEQVKEKLNLPYTYTEMRKMITVVNDNNTRMLDITAESADPEEAAQIANAYAVVVSDYIADTMRMDKPSIMSVALIPTNPYNISMIKTVAMSMLIGGVLAGGYVFVQMMLDDKIKTAEDVLKYTGLPNLAVIPVDETAQAKEAPARKNRTRGMKSA